MDTAKNHDPASSTSPAIPSPSPEAPVAPVRRPGDTALTIIAALAFVFALQWARDFFIPLVFGILIAYTLNPVVIWLERLRMPRALASSVVMLALLGSSILVVSSVYNEAQAIMDELPVATYKLTNALRKLDNGEQGPLDKLRNAADTLKKAASSDNDADNKLETSVSAPPAVLIKQPDFDLNDWLLAGSKSAAAFIGQLTMVLFLVFFALVSGNTFKRKLVKLTGPSLTNKKITVQILDDINTSIQKYMLMLLITNTLLGLLTWLALHWIGLDNAGAWALVAALTHIIPYFGSMIAMALIAFAAFLQFESFSMMLLAAFATLAISTFVGMLVSTWMTGRIAKMNAVAVFVALLFGAWLWGVWGMLLCVPVIVVIKVVSQHVEDLHAIAELLSE
ncbi:AI-2E family transporter [Parapusillimonas sp. JC17]|uniref:AI-2E family transporter n=1 Tax=Parapusillimonas sp. JC17 TaxID=3445768 RepID=UPI003F9FD181